LFLYRNLFYLREQTRKAENLKEFLRENFVKIRRLGNLGINGNNWDCYENRRLIPQIKILDFLIYKFTITVDNLFFKDLKNGVIEKMESIEDYLIRIIEHNATAVLGSVLVMPNTSKTLER
tara:strand:- start:31 stop:393 length:363 start_codon:yes stop_codon:yes gene_type:complete